MRRKFVKFLVAAMVWLQIFVMMGKASFLRLAFAHSKGDETKVIKFIHGCSWDGPSKLPRTIQLGINTTIKKLHFTILLRCSLTRSCS
ncbi:uncharacterized protein LOC114739682 isoform X2 [Neltuma alba]|uniref:uncharacterized protein LOC114719418 isoform X2 n=1 Tax=Neltuma alba TaxID=207710 RepID=UPI0010A3B517|nr:uncharacterized protein LOC114719418 isoform X2 [Prosopis alba]XP_028783593.1 uncharacterized protein LOC114739682 isoform X2 [Prosopis alba]